jgi:hypothetical protein
MAEAEAATGPDETGGTVGSVAAEDLGIVAWADRPVLGQRGVVVLLSWSCWAYMSLRLLGWRAADRPALA